MLGCNQFAFLKICCGLVNGAFVALVGLVRVALMGGGVFCEGDQIVGLDKGGDLVVLNSSEFSVSFAAFDLHNMILLAACHSLLLVEVVGRQVGNCVVGKSEELPKG
jgi:hypothetical protein